MSGLKLERVRKSFGNVDVIHGVDLSIDNGEFVVFVGPSGCGKSTLLRLVAGLEEASSGVISIDEDIVTHIEPAKRGVAMVFQSYALYPHMSVEENMGFGLRMTGTDKVKIKRLVQEAAAILHLDELLERKPKQLSGGQRQRVAIGRAIVRKPRVFLFDEPLSNLDAELRVQMRLEISKLHKQLATTMIYVTHDQVEAMTLADKIVVLKEGCIEQVGSPARLYDDPDNLFVAGFIGSPKMNFLSAAVVATTRGSVIVSLSDFGDIRAEMATGDTNLKIGDKVTLGIRPEHFEPQGKVSLQVPIDVIENHGGTSYAHSRSDDVAGLTIDMKGARGAKEGALLEIGFNPERAFLFNVETGKRIR